MINHPTQPDALISQGFTPSEVLNLVTVPVKTKRKATHKHRRKFISSLSVRDYTGEKYRVPNSEDAAQAQRQLLCAKISTVFENNLDFIIQNQIPLESKSMADLAKAASTISEMVSAAHKGIEGPAPSTGMSAVGQLASQMMKGAMAGAMQGAQMTLEERMVRISQLGKRQAGAAEASGDRMKSKAKEIIVEPESP